MNIKAMRNIHLYLGVFFAPLLVFFIITGCWQTFQWHRDQKSGYNAPEVVQSLSSVHTHQKWSRMSESSPLFKYLIILMSVGLLLTTVLGVLMAVKYTKPYLVWICLAFGIFIPCVLIWMAYGH